MSKTAAIRDAFESVLVDGLKGTPVVSDDGEVAREPDGTVVRTAPEASFLSVVRAYLKDAAEPADKRPPLPATGTPKGRLAEHVAKHGLPFGAKPN